MHMRHNAKANFSKYCTIPWKTIRTVLGLIVILKVIENSITLTLPDTRLYYFTQSNARRFYLSREPLDGKGLTGPICPSLFLNAFSPKPAKFYCLMPEDFTH